MTAAELFRLLWDLTARDRIAYARVQGLGMLYRGAVVAEDLRDADLAQGDVGRTERCVPVVRFLAEPPGGFLGFADEILGDSTVAVHRGRAALVGAG